MDESIRKYLEDMLQRSLKLKWQKNDLAVNMKFLKMMLFSENS